MKLAASTGEHFSTENAKPPPKCLNCGGPHGADSPDCPEWKLEKEVAEICAIEKLDRGSAFRKARQRHNLQPRSYAAVAARNNPPTKVPSSGSFPTTTRPQPSIPSPPHNPQNTSQISQEPHPLEENVPPGSPQYTRRSNRPSSPQTTLTHESTTVEVHHPPPSPSRNTGAISRKRPAPETPKKNAKPKHTEYSLQRRAQSLDHVVSAPSSEEGIEHPSKKMTRTSLKKNEKD